MNVPADAQAYLVLFFLDSGESMSRALISDLTGLGEWRIRGIVASLRDEKLVSVSRRGVRITEKGRTVFNNIPITVIDPGPWSLPQGDKFAGVVVHGGESMAGSLFQEYSAAIKAGAESLCAFRMEGGVIVPYKIETSDCSDRRVEAVLKGSNLAEGDLLLVARACDWRLASLAAISAALELLP